MKQRLTILTALTLAACGTSQPSRFPMGGSVTAEGERPAWKRSCSREGEPRAKVEYEDAPGGATVIYTTHGDPTYLRERAVEVARYHNGAAPTRGMHDLADVPHTAMIEYIDQGVRLTLFASARDDVEELRINVQQDVWAKQKRGCAAGQEAL